MSPSDLTTVTTVDGDGEADPRRPLAQLFQLLRSGADGLTAREAARRSIVYGPNALVRRGGRRWARELVRQFTHPLALLLAVAAVLAGLSGTPVLAVAIAAVIVINAAFAFVQEIQAERAVEALAAYLPDRARVLRDGRRIEVEATELVPGDVLVIEEGDRICADARLISGDLEVDLSSLTGESLPAARSADSVDHSAQLVEAPNVVFSGTTCTEGEAQALVTAIGMHTEIGRIAALSQQTAREDSPLERQVKRVAWLIAAVAVGAGLAFMPIGVAAGLAWSAAATFAIGLIVANVPEGLLPTITLALAVGVRDLARRGAVVKRLSAVETLGSTTVICTDKTGTLTENRMRVTAVWLPGGAVLSPDITQAPDERASLLAGTAAACTSAELAGGPDQHSFGDPTELALLELAERLGVGVPARQRQDRRRGTFHFDPRLRRMSTIDLEPDGRLAVHTKGVPESVLPLCTSVATPEGAALPLNTEVRRSVDAVVADYAGRGLRLLAVARRPLTGAVPDRAGAECELGLLGLVVMVDPPRPQVAAAVRRAHEAGIRIHVVTGDNGLTAAEVARQLGIGVHDGEPVRVVEGAELDAMTEARLDELLCGDREIVFARTAPEAKLRIADALRAQGHIVAMTGDGVNDAPALHHADIGVAMGRSGTDVAREAATMVLTDDDFGTIVVAVEAGRRVFDNVRKFILYIFTHAVPEVVPFLVFALSGGLVPLPLTVLQILAIDLGTDLLPALALSRERAEPGVMARPPRPPSEGVIRRSLLARAWGFLGVISAVLVMAGFLFTLWRAGWVPGAATGPGSPLNLGYRRATSVAWLGIVFCQIGTGFAARTERASLRRIGVFSNRYLLGGIAVSLAFAALLIYLPALNAVFGTAPLGPEQLAVIVPFPFLVWGSDELRRAIRRRRPNHDRGRPARGAWRPRRGSATRPTG